MGSGTDREVNASSSNFLSDGGKLLTSNEEIQRLTNRGQCCQRTGDISQALKHFESAWEKTKELNEKDGVLKFSCHFNYGVCLVCGGQFGKALEILRAAEEILPVSYKPDKFRGTESERVASRDTDCCWLADLHYYIGEALVGQGQYDQASHSFKLAVDEHVKSRNKRRAAGVLCTLARCHHKAGQSEKEVSSYISAQQLYAEADDEGGQAMVCADLAMLYLRLGHTGECQKMLSTARMLSLRLEHSRMQGQLYAQLGLVYSAMKMYGEALRSFEHALPLLRMSTGDGSESDLLKMEAGLLQNIGAVHNEQGEFSEAVIYHKAAAVLNGKAGDPMAEAKCYCNLAFAYGQLKDFVAAAESFSLALTIAKSVGNLTLTFQALEGLGAVSFCTQQLSKAADYFQQALQVLAKIKDDTGMARERVMEKLSDVSMALQQKDRGSPQHTAPLVLPAVSQLPPIAPHPAGGRRHSKLSRSHPASTSVELSRKKGGWRSRHTSVTPLPLVLTPHQVSPVTQPGSDEASSSQHRLTVPSLASSTPGPSAPLDDSCGQEMQAYLESYRSEAGSLLSSTLTSLTSSTGSDSSNILGSSVFSRRALAAAAVGTSSGLLRTPTEIQEGCLALGPDARLHYTTKEVYPEQGGMDRRPGKRKMRRNRRPTQIVPVAHDPSPQQPLENPLAVGRNNRTSSSSVCVVL